MTASAEVTLLVVPRERFGLSRRSLESIYANTDTPFTLIYVDGGSPTATRRYLAAQSSGRGFRLLRTDAHLTPNQARNLGIAHVTTPYLVFLDNDVLVTPGWLEALLRCARETGASVVGPLYCMGEFEEQTVHMTGGHAHIFEKDGKRRFQEDHRFWSRPLPEVLPGLRREPCEMVEFHCMLVASRVFQQLGPLDEGLKSALENPDFCMSVRRSGGEVYFEPASLVTYLFSPAALGVVGPALFPPAMEHGLEPGLPRAIPGEVGSAGGRSEPHPPVHGVDPLASSGAGPTRFPPRARPAIPSRPKAGPLAVAHRGTPRPVVRARPPDPASVESTPRMSAWGGPPTP